MIEMEPNLATKKPSATVFDRTDLLLNHNNINNIDPSLAGMVLLHEAERTGPAPRRLYWGFGNIREEVRKGSRTQRVAAVEFVHFSYKAGATLSQYQAAVEHLPITGPISSQKTQEDAS